ncbi:MAG TPA: GNAT family N-acetyltransferase [Solirubrobacterales bacterium]
MGSNVTIRRATSADADEIGRLLHDFNREFDEPTQPAAVLAERASGFIEDGTLVFLLAGEGPDGIAQMRYLRTMWDSGLSAYLEELYVVPALRGKGTGRVLLEAAMETARAAGATHMDLNTGETDTAARALYESAGFTNREGREDGPSMLYYERDL